MFQKKKFGTNGHLLLWIKDFLIDHPQQVLVQSNISDEIILNIGVPQGYFLSPVLFSMYINEMQICDDYFSM